jgi:hypothetical protein
MGMENSLHALIFWCVIWQGVVFLLRVQAKEKPNFWGLTVVLILLVWTRLDSALIAILLFTFCVGMLAHTYRHNFGLFLKRHGKDMAGAGLLAGLGLSAQLIAFRLMGDSFLPISALIKTSGARGSDIAPIDKLAEVFVLGMPSILQGRFPTLILILLGFFGVLVVILASVNMREWPPETRAFLNLWSFLFVGEIGYYVSVALSSAEYTPYFIWYRSPSFIFWIITGSLIALFAFGYAGLAKKTSNALRLAPVGLSLVVFALAIYMFARSINFTSNLHGMPDSSVFSPIEHLLTWTG